MYIEKNIVLGIVAASPINMAGWERKYNVKTKGLIFFTDGRKVTYKIKVPSYKEKNPPAPSIQGDLNTGMLFNFSDLTMMSGGEDDEASAMPYGMIMLIIAVLVVLMLIIYFVVKQLDVPTVQQQK
jgi:hypothetical protein